MKRTIHLLLAILLLSASVRAQSPMRDLLLQMPDSLLPYLSHANRLDIIDYFDAKMKAEVTNELQGKSLLTALTDDSLSIQLNEACVLDVLLLDVSPSSADAHQADSINQVIAVAHTYRLSTGEQERTVAYFDRKWHRLSDTSRLPARVLGRLSSFSHILQRDADVMKRDPVMR